MPNHITTQITGPTALINAITRSPTPAEQAEHDHHEQMVYDGMQYQGRASEYQYTPLPDLLIDFNMIIPQPENIEIGNCTGQHSNNVVCWYTWNTTHWGTKWNGYRLRTTSRTDQTVQLTFETAWSHPAPVIVALSTHFPDDVLHVAYADENLGQNLGRYSILNGVKTVEPFASQAAELDFASHLIYGMTYDELQA